MHAQLPTPPPDIRLSSTKHHACQVIFLDGTKSMHPARSVIIIIIIPYSNIYSLVKNGVHYIYREDLAGFGGGRCWRDCSE